MDRIVTWPNGITITRGLIGILGIEFATQSQVCSIIFDSIYRAIATQSVIFIIGISILFVFGMVPDFIDGWVARWLNQESYLGEFIDPLVDKILFYWATLRIFVDDAWLPVLFFLLLCDIISTILHFAKTGGAVMSGKIKFVSQCVSLGLFACGVIFVSNLFFVIANSMLVCASVCAVHSLWYRMKN